MPSLSSSARGARLGEAVAHLRAGAPGAAEAALRAMLAETGDDPVLLSNLGVALDAQGRLAEAAACYRAALAIRPGHVEAQYNLGTVLLKLGHPQAAAPHLQRVAALAPDRPQLRADAALARISAEAAMAGAPLAPASTVEALLFEAEDLRGRGLEHAAIDRLHRALALAPAHGPAACAAGELCVWHGRLTEARHDLTVAMRWVAEIWQPVENPPGEKRFDRAAARTALFDLLDAMAPTGQPCFLNGGTLLGCVREGDFISFDSDIDVGVLPGCPAEAVIEAIDAHPRLTFLYHDIHRDAVLRVRFRSEAGIGGDVFLYQRTDDVMWCGVQRGSLALRWADTPFTLRPMAFLGRDVLVPDPPERYLAENYGAWQVPDPDHVPGFSAPNLMDPASDLSRCTLYLSLIAAMLRGNAVQALRYCREALHRFPEDALLAETLNAIRERRA